jgi:hypothetical protein
MDSSSQIVGDFVAAATVQHGFLRGTDGTYTTIDIPGVASTGGISGINDRGQAACPEGADGVVWA